MAARTGDNSRAKWKHCAIDYKTDWNVAQVFGVFDAPVETPIYRV